MAARSEAPTMKVVAQRANVSVQTVSAVINGKPGITEPTRIRVLEAVRELGYRPYSIARSLRTRETHTIALVVSEIANPGFATMASAAEDCAHSFGYSVVLYNTHDDIEREQAYIKTATERWVDGMLFVSAEDRMTSLNRLKELGIPSVAMDRIPEGYEGPSVTLDNIKAGRIAARHLIDLGHRRLAHISGPMRLRLARERALGFEQTIAEYGLPDAVTSEGEGTWACQSGYTAARQLLSCRPIPTAIFAANDRSAIGAMLALHEAGLRVPHDISIVGLDDFEVAAFQIPPLTTVRQSFADMATQAVQLLLAILADNEPAQTTIIIEPTLIVRQSTAPPPRV